MSICTNPYAILPIGINECIGLSLNTINSYYQLIKDESCLQGTEIDDITTQIFALSSEIYTLSAEMIGVPKAFVTFSGSVSTIAGTLVKFHNHNVDEVSVVGPGEYNITFTPTFSSEGYGILATCTQTLTGSSYVFASTTASTPTSAGVKITNKAGDPATPELVAVSFFY